LRAKKIIVKFMMAAKNRLDNCSISPEPFVVVDHPKPDGDLQNLDRFLD
jgi:hypothetical protein